MKKRKVREGEIRSSLFTERQQIYFQGNWWPITHVFRGMYHFRMGEIEWQYHTRNKEFNYVGRKRGDQ